MIFIVYSFSYLKKPKMEVNGCLQINHQPLSYELDGYLGIVYVFNKTKATAQGISIISFI